MTRFAYITGLIGVLASGCSNSTHPSVESQTHWLTACEKDASCGDALSCICGVCIAACSKDLSCNVAGRDTECVMANATPARTLCEEPAPKPICLESCTKSSCPNGQTCSGGVCLPKASTTKDAGTDGGHGGSGGGGSGTGGSGGSNGDAGNPCANEPACGSQCPPGMDNPRDKNGCITSCSCTGVDAGAGMLQWFTTCGSPVCGISPDPFDDPNIPNCTTEKEGQSCKTKDVRCDGVASCGASLICTDTDPTAGPGRCPISRARYKQDIAYVTESDLRAYSDQILNMPLAAYHYRSAPNASPQLGFIIEDIEPSVAVSGDHVNMYGYLSMAVAAIQTQHKQIEQLEQQVRALRAQVAENDSASMCSAPAAAEN
jgi:hypothetical protein